MTKPRIITTVIAASAALAAVALFLTTSARNGGRADPEPASPTEASSAALSVPLEYFDGETGNLSDFAGTPVVLNFWASWCPTCVAEMPDLAAVHTEYQDRVVFLGLNMQEVDLDAARSLIERTGVRYRMVHDRDGAIFRQFGGIAMPTTVLIAADGSVVRVHAGALFGDDLADLIERDLLS